MELEEKLYKACQNATAAYDALRLIGADKHLPGYNHCLTFLNNVIEEYICHFFS